jgi:hypothetical protein
MRGRGIAAFWPAQRSAGRGNFQHLRPGLRAGVA